VGEGGRHAEAEISPEGDGLGKWGGGKGRVGEEGGGGRKGGEMGAVVGGGSRRVGGGGGERGKGKDGRQMEAKLGDGKVVWERYRGR